MRYIVIKFYINQLTSLLKYNVNSFIQLQFLFSLDPDDVIYVVTT